MQPLKISRQPSRNFRPRRYLIWAGIVGLLLLVIMLLSPFVVRSQRAVITREIDDIRSSDPARVETRLLALLSATGGDQEVARVLGAHYSGKNQHIKAAKIYEKARGGLLIESAEQYALAQDNKNSARVSKRSTGKRPTADSLSWQGIAFLNESDVDRGCEKSRESVAQNQASAAAKRVQSACDLMRSQEKDPWKLVEAGLLKIASDSLRNESSPTTASLVLLSQLDQQRGDSQAALTSLERAYKQTPFDRGVLDAIKTLCSDQPSATQCSSLISPVDRARELLTPR